MRNRRDWTEEEDKTIKDLIQLHLKKHTQSIVIEELSKQMDRGEGGIKMRIDKWRNIYGYESIFNGFK